MTETSKSSGAQSQPGSQSSGADQAKAYVPPQILKAKPKGQVHGAKVEIKAGVDPRRAKTVVGMGVPTAVAAATATTTPTTQPALPTPPEVMSYQMSTTPPGGVAVNGGLPFKAAAPAPAAAAPSNGFDYPTGPKSPPLKLVSPGELLPLPSPVGGAAAAHAPADAGHAAAEAGHAPADAGHAPADAGHAPADAAAMPFAAPAALPVAATPDLSMTPPPVVIDSAPAEPDNGAEPGNGAGAAGAAASPWGGAGSAAAEVADAAPDAGEAPAGKDAGEDGQDTGDGEVAAGEHPLATTNSPWLSAHSVDAEVLPSSAMLTPAPAVEPEQAAAPVMEAEAKGSSTGMTIGLALAALALVGALAYFILAKDSGVKDPAEVKVGTEQEQYEPEPTAPTPVETATAQPAPKPTIKPVAAPATSAKPVVPKRPPKPVDIYEDY